VRASLAWFSAAGLRRALAGAVVRPTRSLACAGRRLIGVTMAVLALLMVRHALNGW
jgi:hypothetical protein